MLMIAIVSVVVSAESGIPVMAPHSEHPAGCHNSLPKQPAPTPASFRCCISGHHWAMPGAAFQMVVLQPRLEQRENLQFASASRQFVPGIFASDSPPDVLPLRI